MDYENLGKIIYKHCGYEQYLVVEFYETAIPRLLKLAGIETHVVRADRAGDGDVETQLHQALAGLAKDRRYRTVVATLILDTLDRTVIHGLLEALAALTSRSLVLIVSEASDRNPAAVTRRAWENTGFEHGLRKHPLYYAANDYAHLQNEHYPLVIPLERIPEAALNAYPLRALAEERDLHMDMLRETGSRSDAHVIRYVLAAQHVRPGDRVLDAACGLGYGTYLLSQLSKAGFVTGVDASTSSAAYATANYAREGSVAFEEGFLPECLAGIETGSIDLIVTYETLEHVADARPLLQEFRRIMAPGARIIASVPNDWTDHTGTDPNPYHLQVYDAAKFVAEIESCFALESLMSQTADRAKKIGGRPGEFVPRPRMIQALEIGKAENAIEAEWLLAVATKSVEQGSDVPYAERAFSARDVQATGHALAVARDYDNPWIFRTLVSIGLRVGDAAVRRRLAALALKEAEPGSADAGALLCIIGYTALEAPDRPPDPDLLGAIDAYIDASHPGNPTVMRWTISLGFLRAIFALIEGDRARARDCFGKVIASEAETYSVTLLTKPAEAAFRLGCMHLADGDPDQAKSVWETQYTRIRSSIKAFLDDQGSERPASFVFYEVSEIFGILGRIAGALQVVDEARHRPLAFALETERDLMSQLRLLGAQVNRLEEARQWFSGQLQALLRASDEKDAWMRDLTEGKNWCEAQWRAAETDNAGLRKLLADQQEWVRALEEARTWLEDQLKVARAGEPG